MPKEINSQEVFHILSHVGGKNRYTTKTKIVVIVITDNISPHDSVVYPSGSV